MAVIGIDLGTTNSVAAYVNRGKVEIIPIDGMNTMSSVVGVRNNETIVGNQAKSRLLIDPENTIASSKRKIGQDIKYKFGEKTITPGDIAYEILKKIKVKVIGILGEDIDGAVVTVPAYFTPEQRKITKIAAEKAGLQVLRIMPEPTAAAIDYGINAEEKQTIMVYDLGGGTFDISIMKVNGNEFEILSVDGDSSLGGDDFDEVICEMLYSEVNKELKIDLKEEKDKKYILSRAKIKETAERAKKDLSELTEIDIVIPNLIDDYSLERVITRDEFNESCKHLIDRTIEKIDGALKNINYTEEDIDKVILVGGSTKMPIIKETITEKIKEPYIASNVDEVVARGAAYMAASLIKKINNEDEMEEIEEFENISDINEIEDSHGTDETNETIKISGDKISLVEEKEISDDTNKIDLEKNSINLSKKVIVRERTVFSYGVDMLDRNGNIIFKPIIKKGTILPVENGVIGFTADPYQTHVEFNVFRGEEKNPLDNEYIGELGLNISNPTEKSIPVLALFSMDEDMIIRFRSVEVPTEKEFMDLIQAYDIEKLKSYVEEDKLSAVEITIDTNEFEI